ncbi:hypothetical protein [Jiangella asiatica]|uniref:GH16 domain-containing protein n=1 Tax=Jiangella asiatica TaxID=2530372 RepID=A0A4R5DAJ6_9ACTN|nr:hypothetical protein [Jiangella asiatica]TDE09857.1 hypothetical protein E1269_12820 [Jiangella asiatica]
MVGREGLRRGALSVVVASAAVTANAALGVSEPDDNEVSASPGWHDVPTLCNSGLRLVPKASDEFDRRLGSKWRLYDYYDTSLTTGTPGRRSGELYYRTDMVSMDDGTLSLSIVDEPEDVDGDGSLDYPAGGVESTFDVPGATERRASCVEVRTQGFAANVASHNAWDQNVFSAVWMTSRPPSHETNPNPEIDIQEFFWADEMHMALHLWESPPPPESPTPAEHTAVDNCRTGRADQTEDPAGTIDDCETEPLGDGMLTDAMHTYAVRREIVQVDGSPVGLLTFYFDGRPTWTKELPADSPLITQARHLILSTQGNPPGGPGLDFPKVAEHDWVRTYN